MSIQERIRQIRDEKGLTQADFANKIGMKRGTYSMLETGKMTPTIETVVEIANAFGINYLWLLEGKGDAQLNAQPNAQVLDRKGKNRGKITGNDGDPKGDVIGDLTHVIDTSGHRLVPIVDISAAAGEGYLNVETLDETDVFRLPQGLVRGKNPLCIRIKGTSMAPTFQDGGFLIVTLLDRSEWLNMPDQRCYVVVDGEGKTYFKRIKNRFSGEKGGFIVLNSDSPDRQAFPSFNLHPDEIAYIWYVEMYLTHKMPNIHDQYYTRLQNLEDEFQEIRDQFRSIVKRLK